MIINILTTIICLFFVSFAFEITDCTVLSEDHCLFFPWCYYHNSVCNNDNNIYAYNVEAGTCPEGSTPVHSEKVVEDGGGSYSLEQTTFCLSDNNGAANLCYYAGFMELLDDGTKAYNGTYCNQKGGCDDREVIIDNVKETVCVFYKSPDCGKEVGKGSVRFNLGNNAAYRKLGCKVPKNILPIIIIPAAVLVVVVVIIIIVIVIVKKKKKEKEKKRQEELGQGVQV